MSQPENGECSYSDVSWRVLLRYGQTRKVKVFRLLSDATIDIDIIQERLELNVEKVIESQPPRKLEFRQHDKVEGYVFHVSL